MYLTTVKRNIRRTPYQALAVSMVMFLTFLTLIVFMFIAIGSQKILKYYESKPQAIAFFKDGTTEQDIRIIENALIQTGKVTSLKYVSKEEALQIYKDRNKNNPTLLELVTANILPSSLEISTYSPKDLEPIAQILKKEPVVEEVTVPEDVIQSLTNATSFLRSLGVVIVGFLIVFSILVLLMVIGFKIRIKRTEIEIMKLLGASTWFIRAPFIIEGIIYCLIGAFLGWTISLLVLWYVTPFVEQPLQDIKIFPVSPLLLIVLLGVSTLSALIIGFTGSYGAVRRYLKL